MANHLVNFELTEEGKKYLPKENGHPQGARIVLPKNGKGDPHFDCRGGLLRDYHCKALLARKDEKGKRFVRAKKMDLKASKTSQK